MFEKFAIFWQNSSNFVKNVILEQFKGKYCVDLGENFQTHIYLQKLTSIPAKKEPHKVG